VIAFFRELELEVQAQRRHQDGAAVAIVAGIDYVLKPEGSVSAAPDVQRVVRFDYILAAIIEAAIP
jgi:hypothetical protein